jgi:hypothetical protein
MMIGFTIRARDCRIISSTNITAINRIIRLVWAFGYRPGQLMIFPAIINGSQVSTQV